MAIGEKRESKIVTSINKRLEDWLQCQKECDETSQHLEST